MPAIIYCLPQTNKGQPTAAVYWDAVGADGSPTKVGLVPKIIDTEDEQVLFRTIAPFVNDVVGIQVFSRGVSVGKRNRAIAASNNMPRTFIARQYTGETLETHNRSCLVHDKTFIVRGDTVVFASDVKETQRAPAHKCLDHVQMGRIAYARSVRSIKRERWGFVTDARDTPSIITLTPKTVDSLLARETSLTPYDAKLEVVPVTDVAIRQPSAPRPLATSGAEQAPAPWWMRGPDWD